MRMRSICIAATITLSTALSVSLLALQAPPAGQRGAAPAGAPAPAAGQRGTAPVGQLPAPGAPGGRGGPRTPDGALAATAPHPDPLPIDLFTSRNFYKDKALWSDPKYFRCNISRILTEVWADNRMGSNPPATAGWGDCSRDIPAAQIKSPYPHKTAKEHYEALMAEAKTKGGPTVHTRQTLPDWDGFYQRQGQARTQWL